jgi:hypothetical protein
MVVLVSIYPPGDLLYIEMAQSRFLVILRRELNTRRLPGKHAERDRTSRNRELWFVSGQTQRNSSRITDLPV